MNIKHLCNHTTKKGIKLSIELIENDLSQDKEIDRLRKKADYFLFQVIVNHLKHSEQHNSSVHVFKVIILKTFKDKELSQDGARQFLEGMPLNDIKNWIEYATDDNIPLLWPDFNFPDGYEII